MSEDMLVVVLIQSHAATYSGKHLHLLILPAMQWILPPLPSAGCWKLREKISIFKSATKTKKAVHFTLLTTYGIEPNKHSGGLVQSVLTMDDLFTEG